MLRKALGSSAGAPKSIDISLPTTPNRSDPIDDLRTTTSSSLFLRLLSLPHEPIILI
jgi:hypothetical protein